MRRAILSVLYQTYTNIQVNVFDDASGDETSAIVDAIKAKDPRISYYCREKNVGGMLNVKLAYETIDTPYYCQFADDDVLAFDFFEKAANILDQNPDLMFVSLNLLTINEHGDLTDDDARRGLHFYRGADRLYAPGGGTTYTAVLFRKEAAATYLKMNDQYDVGQDMRLLMLLRAKYNFAHLSEVGAFFTCHSSSSSAARKHFDVVYYAVQMSRYVELFYTQGISTTYKRDAVLAIKDMLTPSFRKSLKACVEVLRVVTKNLCDEVPPNKISIFNEVQNAKDAGFASCALLLALLKNNRTVREILKLIFSGYYRRIKIKRKTEMNALQNGIYKIYFERLRSISESKLTSDIGISE